MAILFATGFEGNHILSSHPNITILDTSLVIVATPVRTGNYALRHNSTGHWGYLLDSVTDELYVALAFNYTSGSAPRLFFTLQDGKSITIFFGNGNAVVAQVDGVTVATGSTIVSAGDWHHLKAGVNIADSGGTIQVYLDGHLEIDYTGDTQPGTSPNSIYRVSTYTLGTSTFLYTDDFVIDDSQFPGDYRIERLAPTADTATKDWTASAGGDNYALVDEVPPNTSDYVLSTVNGDRDLYEVGDWTGTDKTPIAVVVWHYAVADVASGQFIKQLLDSNGTLQASANKELGLAYQFFDEILPQDPDTASAWDDTGIDGILIGQESVI